MEFTMLLPIRKGDAVCARILAFSILELAQIAVIAVFAALNITLYHVPNFFIDPNVALVQTPQHFCNPDAFQKNLELQEFLSNEQDMFYRVIEPSLNEMNSVFCGGTNIILERKHLASVGNFAEDTITNEEN